MHYLSAIFGNMSGMTGILRRGIRHLVAVSLLAVLCAGCRSGATPPSEEWLRENFQAHESEFDEIATIALSVPMDDCFVYPAHINGDTLTRTEQDSIFFAELGEAKRERLDSLLTAVKCVDMTVAPVNRNISLTCYRYGSIRGLAVTYAYMGKRPSALTFVEDKDIYDAFQYWQSDKSKRPFPRKELNAHWHIEYQQ